MKISSSVGSVDIKIDTSRIDKNLEEAQKLLNMQIVADCEPLIPFQQGELRRSVNYPNGICGGEIEWNSPYAHFQYAGYVRTDENGRVFVGKYEKKPVLTDRPLYYSQPETTKEWFEEAKKKHKDEWLHLVRKTVGKG